MFSKKTLSLFVFLILLGHMSCGKGKKASSGENPRTLTPPGLGPQNPIDPQPGVYRLVGNECVNIIIERDFTISTTLVMPIKTGNNSRITPVFPAALHKDPQSDMWNTVGFFNRDGKDYSNVELRTNSYEFSGENRLDIQLAFKLRSGESLTNINTSCGVVNPQQTMTGASTRGNSRVDVQTSSSHGSSNLDGDNDRGYQCRSSTYYDNDHGYYTIKDRGGRYDHCDGDDDNDRYGRCYKSCRRGDRYCSDYCRKNSNVVYSDPYGGEEIILVFRFAMPTTPR